MSRKYSLAGISSRKLIYDLLTLENEGSKFLQNTGIQLPCDRGSDLIRRESSYLIYFLLPVNTYSHHHLLLQTAQISNKFIGSQYETYTDLYVPYVTSLVTRKVCTMQEPFVHVPACNIKTVSHDVIVFKLAMTYDLSPFFQLRRKKFLCPYYEASFDANTLLYFWSLGYDMYRR